MTPPETPDCNHDAPASFAAPHGSVPTVEQCLWMADTYCQRDSWQNDFWRPHVSVLASEVRRLKSAIEETLRENAHLADGDNCTLAALKRAIAPNDKVSDPRQ